MRGRGFCAEDAGEDGVHCAQLALQIECVRESFFIEEFANACVGGDAVLEAGF